MLQDLDVVGEYSVVIEGGSRFARAFRKKNKTKYEL